MGPLMRSSTEGTLDTGPAFNSILEPQAYSSPYQGGPEDWTPGRQERAAAS